MSEVDDIKKLKFGEELVYFLKTFADKCHHGKEENYLFKELENHGIPNKEHQEGRAYLALMNKAVESSDLANFKINVSHYSDLLRNHIEKENNVLFAMADKILDQAMQHDLFEKFEQHE